VLDFSEDTLRDNDEIEAVLIGPEGGFSETERALVKNNTVRGLTCNTILRSETAVVSVVAKIML